MKIRTLLVAALAVAFSSFAVSCGDDTDNNAVGIGPDPEPYPESELTIDIEDVDIEAGEALEFTSKAPERFEVSVKSPAAWEVSTGNADWIQIEMVNDGFVVTANRNRTLEAKTGVVTITAGDVTETINVTQSKGRLVAYHFPYGTAGAIAASPNGRYILGSSPGKSWILDLYTLDSEGQSKVEVSVDQVEIITGGNNRYRFINNKKEIATQGGTPDGSITLGYDNANQLKSPYFVKNGTKVYLEAPIDHQIGPELIPHQGYWPVGISADAKYIAGVHALFAGGLVEVGWKLNEMTGTYEYVFDPTGNDFSGSQSVEMQAGCISYNGKWTGGAQKTGTARRPYVRNLETGEIILYKTFGDTVTHITDDGYAICLSTVWDINNPESNMMSFGTYLKVRFGISDEELGELGLPGQFYIQSMTPDDATIVGFYINSNGSATLSYFLNVE